MLARLNKLDAETLMAAIDSPLLVDVLRSSLSKVLGVEPFEDDWGALVRFAGHRAGWSEDRVTLLVGRDVATLSGLAVELNELRTIV
jgi:hypothetical protein